MTVPALIPWLTTSTGGSSAQLNTFYIVKSKALSKSIHLAEIQKKFLGRKWWKTHREGKIYFKSDRLIEYTEGQDALFIKPCAS